MTGCNTGGAGSETALETGGNETDGSDTASADVTGLVCDTDGVAGGQWATEDVEDWSNPGDTGLDAVAFEDDDLDPLYGVQGEPGTGVPCVDAEEAYPDLEGTVDRTFLAHHCYTTAVHAVHMQTDDARVGSVLVMHGENDQRVWEIGSEPEDMTWHPVPVRTRWQVANDADDGWDDQCGLPDLFCSGHIQLYDGRVFVAGGNVTGSPSGGALRETYLFDPSAALTAPAPDAGPGSAFGWLFEEAEEDDRFRSVSPPAVYDRWYPTLTALPDGRVLISGGSSRAEWDANPSGAAEARSTRVLEVYDPTNSNREAALQVLPGEDSLFPNEGGVPQYPYMFVLPNGDVFYAGSEASGIAESQQHFGQILVVDYDKQPEDEWFWLDLGVGITSDIRGGSAVMYRPGQVLKTGGLDLDDEDEDFDPLAAVNLAETIDLSAYAAGERPTPEDPVPEVAPPAAFSPASPMTHARHYHTMNLLPDGTVLATGGNRFDNSQNGENYNNPCEVLGARIDEIPCDQGCPSICTRRQIEVANPYSLECDPPNQTYGCSVIGAVACRTAAQCAAALDDEETPDDECLALSGCERDVNNACVTTFDYDCDDALAGSTCAPSGFCSMGCEAEDEGDICGLIMPVDDVCLTEARPRAAEGMCSPHNNACYATYAAEIWDPACDEWTVLGDQQHPQMYHSTALLMPDARVISMGGGHRGVGSSYLEEQVISEYFEPAYSDGGAAPAFDEPAPGVETLPIQVIPCSNGDALAEITVAIPGEGVAEVDHVALIKLGSVTHGFDMGQTYMRLGASSGNTATSVTLSAAADDTSPFDRNTAPPGHYMMFLMSAAGEPSTARYVQLGATLEAGYVCEATSTLVASETSCTQEPISAACPAGDEEITAVSLPMVALGSTTVPGFRVVAPAGSIRDPEVLTDAEVAAIHALCSMACEQHFEGQVGQSANCTAPGAFEAPMLDNYPEHGPLDLIHSTHRQGGGLFPPEELDCDLGLDCYIAFDEVLRPMASDRVTPAADTLAIAEEWRIGVAGEMQALASTGGSPVEASLVGTIGYSLCTDGNAEGPCPFYLGSMEFELSESLVLPVECGSATETHTLSSLSVRLEQPAFGISQEDTAWKGFPPGVIVLDAEGVVDGLPFHVRRTNQEPLYLRAGEGWTLLQGVDGAWLEFTVPCEEESAEVLVWWGYSGVSLDDRLPAASIGIANTVPCPSTVTLTKSVADADDDLESVRWRVDGVLMEDGITSMDFTGPHDLELVARDARGATATAKKTVGCQ